MQQKQIGWNNWLLILGVVFLVGMPLILVKNSEFGGSDNQAAEAIQEVQPSYKPWFEPVVKLPGGQVESLLFSVQAAAGAGVIGYVIGLYRGRGFREVKSKK